MLWLCLHFPDLPLDVFARGASATLPRAVASAHRERPLVVICDSRAARLGIAPGMSVSAARALAHDIVVHVRDERAERAALRNLAAWAGQFTPSVSLAPPNALLLEISASLKLLGELRTLMRHVKNNLHALGYGSRIACAPTPLAALFLARAGAQCAITVSSDIERVLAKLSLGVLDAPREAIESLQALGIHTLGDCLHLPRDGLARRFGQQLLDDLDRALGALPDAREFFVPPDRFAAKLELPSEVSDTGALLFAARRLLAELCDYLRARASAVARFDLRLLHAGEAVTEISIGLAFAGRDAPHFTLLLRERLGRLVLPAPVRSLHLSAEDIRPLAPRNLSLLPDPVQTQEDGRHLIERLRARLGVEAVRSVALVEDHRPECAFRESALDENVDRAPARHNRDSANLSRATLKSRPLWLLAQPRRLDAPRGEPYLDGSLALRAGPERIESGWWDFEVGRDYFVAVNPRGERFWIYREHGGECNWFLHGIFS
jgi:protein ImuB